MFQHKDKDVDVQHALRGVTFDIKKGDFFGIVGRNGSGKSTLLKIIAEIYKPTKGNVTTHGKLVPFIELGVGFNPELTGKENIYLNGALLGFSKKEMDAKYKEIVRFAELEDFMDQKLKNYSSGMQVRLAFSVAIQADADILLLDEVLAVGDEAFQRKCNDYFKQLKDSKKTVVLVTHSMENVRKFCNKAMMVQDGKVKILGSPDDVANEYSLENIAESSDNNGTAQKKDKKIMSLDVELLSPRQINQDDRVIVKYTILPLEDITARVVTDLWNVSESYYVYCIDSPEQVFKKGVSVTLIVEIDVSKLNNMSFAIHTAIRDGKDNIVAFASDENSPKLILRRTDYRGSTQAGAIYRDGENVKWQ